MQGLAKKGRDRSTVVQDTPAFETRRSGERLGCGGGVFFSRIGAERMGRREGCNVQVANGPNVRISQYPNIPIS